MEYASRVKQIGIYYGKRDREYKNSKGVVKTGHGQAEQRSEGLSKACNSEMKKGVPLYCGAPLLLASSSIHSSKVSGV